LATHLTPITVIVDWNDLQWQAYCIGNGLQFWFMLRTNKTFVFAGPRKSKRGGILALFAHSKNS
jgi:hypothetical protein